MLTRSKLRNSLIRKIQQLSADKLAEASALLNKLESHIVSKEKTLKMAGSWKDLDKSVFNDFTDNLHAQRKQDREITDL